MIPADDPKAWEVADSCDHAEPQITECHACRSRRIERRRLLRAIAARIGALSAGA